MSFGARNVHKGYQVRSTSQIFTEPAAEIEQEAVTRLNSLQTGYEALIKKRQTVRTPDTNRVAEMRKCHDRIGYSSNDLNLLNVIHIAGTKGKGSAATFVDSILREHREKTGFPKVGLFTSPHLNYVRERIQINSAPIPEETFAKYFSKVWDKLAPGDRPDINFDLKYYQVLTLIAIDVFLTEGVDAAIFETGVGGRFDPTNIFETPVAVGITTLGIDHVRTLRIIPEMRPPYLEASATTNNKGEATVAAIAWHKGGIMKSGSPAFSVVQKSEAMDVLRRIAEEKDVILTFIGNGMKKLPISPKVQKLNATLAVALANAFLNRESNLPGEDPLVVTKETMRGLERARWAGRFQVLQEANNTWFVDGAHNKESLEAAAEWFAEETAKRERKSALPKVLIFNHQSQRDGDALLRILFLSLKNNGVEIAHVIFCTDVVSKHDPERIDFVNHNKDPGALMKLAVQKEYATVWRSLDIHTHTAVVSTVEDAVAAARNIGDQCDGMQTLVTGNLHLVSSALLALESSTSAQEDSPIVNIK